jgi:hypothetical protein
MFDLETGVTEDRDMVAPSWRRHIDRLRVRIVTSEESTADAKGTSA